MREASRPARDTTVPVTDGVVEIDLVLAPSAVVLCEITPRHDRSAEYPGLDDDRLPVCP